MWPPAMAAAAACLRLDTLPRSDWFTWPMVSKCLLVRLSRRANGIDHELGVALLVAALCVMCLLVLLPHGCKQTRLALLLVYNLLHEGGRQARLCCRGEDLRLRALVDASLLGQPICHATQLVDCQGIVVEGYIGLRDRSQLRLGQRGIGQFLVRRSASHLFEGCDLHASSLRLRPICFMAFSIVVT